MSDQTDAAATGIGQAYDVTAFVHEGGSVSGASTFTVDATSLEEAREQVEAYDTVDEVIEATPKKIRLRVEVRGTTEQLAAALDDVADSAEFAAADVSVMDEAAHVHLDAGDDDDAAAYAVRDWNDVRMRITGLSEALGEGGDGMDVSTLQLAAPDSTVEFMVGDTVLAKVVKEGDVDG